MFSAAIKSGAAAASAPVDAQFNYVTMLLHGDGTNGANNGGVNTSGVTPFNTDASTNAFPVTINGDTKPNNFNPYQAGYYGNYFPSGSMLSTAYSSAFDFGTGDFTMEAWVNLDSLPAPQTIFSCVDAGATVGYSLLILANGFVEVDVVAAQSFICNSNPVQAKTWTHVAFTKSSGTYRAFVNGSLCTTSANTLGTTINSTSQGMCVARSVASGYNFPLAGYISNARIVKGTALYTSSFTPSTTPLTAVSGTSLLTCQSNRFIDNSASPFTLSLTGTPSVSYNQPFTVPSTYSTYGAGYFDGTGDYLSVADNAAFAFGTNSFTIEAWVFPTGAFSNYTTIIAQSDNGSASSQSFDILVNSSGAVLAEIYIGGSAYSITSSATLSLNAWSHVALVRNGSTFTLYINGTASGTPISNAGALNNSSIALTIGAETTPFRYWTGYITDARIVNGTAVYTTSFTPPIAPLTAITNTSLLTLQTNGPVNDNGFVDSSPNNFAITRNGNTTQGSFSPYGSNWSNYFSSSAYLTVPDNAGFDLGASDFTIEAWVCCTTGAGNNRTIVAKSDRDTAGGEGTFVIQLQDSNVAQMLFSTGGTGWEVNSSGTTTVALNTWYHIAATRSGSTFRLFVNGALEATATSSITLADNAQVVTIAGLGYTSGTVLNYFSGYISNLRIVKGTAVYTSAFTPSTTPLTAITNTSLLTCQSNRFVDNSASPKTISIGAGTPSVQRFNPFGTSTAYSTATIGGSGYFDGSGDYLSIANNTTLNPASSNFSAECWFYIPPSFSIAANGNSLISKSNSSSYGPFTIGFNPSSGYLQCLSSTSGSNWEIICTTSATYTSLKGAWHHVAYVRNGSTFTVYIDGVSSATASSSSALVTNTESVMIGYVNYPSTYFGGYISDVRYVVGSATYTGAFTPPTAPLSVVTSTQLLCNMTNAGIYDNAMMNDLETVGNAQISTSVKKYGTGSMSFDGSTGSYLLTNTPQGAMGTGDFTVECWVYISSLPGAEVGFVSSFHSSGNGFLLDLAGGGGVNKPQFAIGNWSSGSNPYVISPSNFPTSQWVHVAGVRRNGTIYLYINGTSVGTPVSATADVSKTAVVVGRCFPDQAYGGLNGYIDDLRITKGYARYTANFTPPTAAFPNIGPVSS